jgi:NADPH:quinone reductase-like Zn-dependent oxidoreductase
MATMKAVRLHEYGGTEKLVYEEVRRPEPGEGEILVKVHATSINPLDWKLRSGMLKDFWPLALPTIQGADLSGEVVALGTGVTTLAVGDAVFGFSPKNGGYAEFAAVPASGFIRKPENLSFIEAASVPVVALTAWQALFEQGQLQSGQRVLIQGASGGVGMFAVQFAKVKGASVIGTASGRNADFVQALGVDTFIDYTVGPFEEQVADLDLVFDTVGAATATRALTCIKPGGALVVIAGGPSPEEAQKHDVRVSQFGAQPNAAQLAEIGALLDAGTVRTEIEAVFPLADAGKAQDLNQAGRTRGKIVLQVI